MYLIYRLFLKTKPMAIFPTVFFAVILIYAFYELHNNRN